VWSAIAVVFTLRTPFPTCCHNTPGATLNRPSASWPTFQALALPGQPGISFVGACCNTVNWPTTRQVLDRGALVVQSDLQAAFVEQRGHLLAWVTTTRGKSVPVAGARVQVYSTNYNSVGVWLQAALQQLGFS
jgi:hypothetical protein